MSDSTVDTFDSASHPINDQCIERMNDGTLCGLTISNHHECFHDFKSPRSKATEATYRDSIETLVKVLRAHENGDQPFIGDAADALEASVPRSMYDALVKQSKDYAAQADAEIERLRGIVEAIKRRFPHEFDENELALADLEYSDDD